jgi:hypothetical protein
VEVVLDKWFSIERNERLTFFGYVLYLLIIISCVITLLIPIIETQYEVNLSCLFRSVTGLPCLSCGYTRAITNVFKGNLLVSFLFNPFWIVLVLYQIIIILLSIKSIFVSRALLIENAWIKFFVIAMFVNWGLKFLIGEAYY